MWVWGESRCCRGSSGRVNGAGIREWSWVVDLLPICTEELFLLRYLLRLSSQRYELNSLYYLILDSHNEQQLHSWTYSQKVSELWHMLLHWLHTPADWISNETMIIKLTSASWGGFIWRGLSHAHFQWASDQNREQKAEGHKLNSCLCDESSEFSRPVLQPSLLLSNLSITQQPRPRLFYSKWDHYLQNKMNITLYWRQFETSDWNH